LTQSRQNRLLELMPPSDLHQLRHHLREVNLEYKMPLYEARESIEHVYFPISAVASLVSTMSEGYSSEVGTIGNEGVVGIPIILGDTVAPTNVYVQVPGVGLRMPASVLKDVMDQYSLTRKLMLRYVHAFFNQVAQSAACNHFHSVHQRRCRWLLMTHDRVQSGKFILTQEFLAMMLGVRRTEITAAARKLKSLKLIGYTRGHVAILDRAGLENCACECYTVSKGEYDRLLGPPRRDASPWLIRPCSPGASSGP
jgi:CRP-like cAMP-binding protein